MAFMGWSAYREHGKWFATKVVESGGFQPTGLVRIRRELDIPADATKAAAECEILRLYRRGVLE